MIGTHPFDNPGYMLNNFIHFVLGFIGVLAIVATIGFLLFGFMKGIMMEREIRLRRRRRYF